MSITATIRSIPNEKLESLNDEEAELLILNPENIKAEKIPAALDLDKAWHGLIYLISNKKINEEAEKIILGNKKKLFEKSDTGLGPITYCDKEEVKKISKKLQAIDKEKLKKNFDPKDMQKKDIYPNIWLKKENELAYLMDFWDDLVDYYK